MVLKEIGLIKSPYKRKGDAPRQGKLSKELMELEIKNEFAEGLNNLLEGQFIVVLYWCDRSDRNLLKATPPGKDKEKGVFATRSPNRPNPIALNVAKILSIDKNKLIVVGLDALDNSPLIDIKPYNALLDESVEVIEL